MSRPLVVVGAGGHGREVLDIVAAVNAAAEAAGAPVPWSLLGVVDDDPADPSLLERRGDRLLGPVTALADLDADHVVAIGDGEVRRRLDERIQAWGGRAAVLVHPSATVGADVHLGPGVVLAAGAVVTTNVVIGRHSHVNVGAVVSHDVRVGDHVTISPMAAVNGAAHLGDGAFLGTGAIVTPGRVIGERAVVGAGAVVVGDVPAGVTATVVPARW